MIAAVYSRKSKFTCKGESIESQVQICKEYAKNNLKISSFIIYEDEGFSGGNTNRPRFQELLKDARKEKFNFLICYRLDRISRNVADFSTTLELLQKHNISFVSVKEQFDTSTPMGKAMVYIASVFAQLERETIAERVRDNMLELAKSGRWLGGQTPLGFNSKKVTYYNSEMKQKFMHKLSPIQKELDKVKLIYGKYMEFGSISLVLKYLLTNNIKGKNGGDFSSMSINDTLRNPVYVKSNDLVFKYLKDLGITTCGIPNGNGIITYNKRNSKYITRSTSEWIAAVAKHKGIIESTTWLEVQFQLDKNKRKSSPRQGTSKKSLLSGILKCALCGSPMRVSYGRSKKNENKRTYYYVCTMKAHSGKNRCANPNANGPKIEKAIAENIKKLNINKLLKELQYRKNESTSSIKNNFVEMLKREIEDKSNQMNTLLQQLSNINSDASPASEFILNKIENLAKTIKDLNLKLDKSKNIEEENVDLDIMEKALENFNSSFALIKDVSIKRHILENIIDKICWNGNTGDIDVYLWGSEKVHKFHPSIP
ncbi:recombinase family protein [Clostridium autoethanogenum]|uniref:Recombinase family protein n=1 Tax=Clostridium autoethanogenum DSM 10061 TaxID=1341692 RepID=A0ABM5NZV2_9CLOT|nr:recombinase family protein [Clostridium autoethanogenum]AGY78160.1 recombinase family protein [Clostridium autoethanogenum DSM 10061]ALU38293.1 Integrase/recombinase protein [Clostridium autoethanogenum DSM 10061]OVY51056.1 DNA-invertase hin [Clostridium autoethanogenum]